MLLVLTTFLLAGRPREPTMSSTNTRIQIRDLASFTTDPERAGEKMLEAAKVNVQLVKKVQAKNLLEGLKVRKVGTHVTEKAAKMLMMSEVREESVVVKLVEIQRLAAEKKEQEVRKQFRRVQREATYGTYGT